MSLVHMRSISMATRLALTGRLHQAPTLVRCLATQAQSSGGAETPSSYLIQGASRGMGLEFVRQLLTDDAKGTVFATCRSPAAATDLQALQKEHGDRLHVIKLDASDESSIEVGYEGGRPRAGSGSLSLGVDNKCSAPGLFCAQGHAQSMTEQRPPPTPTNPLSPVAGGRQEGVRRDSLLEYSDKRGGRAAGPGNRTETGALPAGHFVGQSAAELCGEHHRTHPGGQDLHALAEPLRQGQRVRPSGGRAGMEGDHNVTHSTESTLHRPS